ncbi:MAG: hypothetical protein RL154_1256 [Pseudomonadota bacterium]|jgi:23S rRNA pseudouridine1911/1915/1917 synthase
MGYEVKVIENVESRKIVPLLVEQLCVSERRAKRLIDKGRVKQNGEIVVKKGQIVSGKIEALVFLPTVDMELNPIYDVKDFAIFDKPSGMLSHPNGFDAPPSLLDYAKVCFGNDANITHRLDALTSGLIIVAKNRATETDFKNMFEARGVQKNYLALLKGGLENEITVNVALKQEPFGDVRLKMCVHIDGKECITTFIPLEICDKYTLVKVIPQTGRMHQIRAHAEHIGHPIFGDPLYGVSSDIAKAYLEKTIAQDELEIFTKAKRLCLHACYLEFCYGNESVKVEQMHDLMQYLI